MSDAPDTEAASPAEGGAKKSALVPMLAAVLVGLGAGGASGALVAGPMLAHRVVPAIDTASLAKQLAGGVKAEVEEPPPEPEKKKEKEKEEGGKKEGEKAEAIPILLMDNIVMNPSGSNGSRFLLMSVSFELKDAASMEKLKAHDSEIRDLVQRVMGKHGIDELIDVKNRELFKKELSAATEEISGKETVKKVFFPQFVIQ